MIKTNPKDRLDALVVERVCEHCGRPFRQINAIQIYYYRTGRLYTEDFPDDLCITCATSEFLSVKERLKELGIEDYLTGKSMQDTIKVAYSDHVDCKYCGKLFYLPDAKQEINNYENYFNAEFGFACQGCARERIDAFERLKQIEVAISNTDQASVDASQQPGGNFSVESEVTTDADHCSIQRGINNKKQVLNEKCWYCGKEYYEENARVYVDQHFGKGKYDRACGNYGQLCDSCAFGKIIEEEKNI